MLGEKRGHIMVMKLASSLKLLFPFAATMTPMARQHCMNQNGHSYEKNKKL